MEPLNDMSNEWMESFSPAPEDCTNSATFVKKISWIMISTISYLKDALPENSYTMETFKDFRLHILKKDCSNGIGNFLSSALADAFDALDKQYLRKLAFCFYEPDCQLGNMIESHVFEYVYYKEGVSVKYSRNAGASTQKHSFEDQTVDLMKAIFSVMRSCQNKLPTVFGISLKLFYYKDTPEDYVAPGFKSDEGVDHSEHDQTKKGLVLGRVDTDFHTLRFTSYVKEYESSAQTAPPNREALPNIPSMSNKTEGIDPRVVCPCSKKDDPTQYQDDVLLTCFYCNTLQHAACFGIFEDATSLSRHCCVVCRDEDATRLPTDLRLVLLPPKRRISLCLFRRALKLCSQREFVDARALADRFRESARNTTRMMSSLHKQGVVQLTPDIHSNNPRNVIKENIKKVFAKLCSLREQNISDSLIDEIEGALSQNTQESVIEHALTTIDKEDLSNASNLGRVIKKPETRSYDENPTLKAYRDIFITEEIVDPLLARNVSDSDKRKMEGTVTDTGNKRRKLQLQRKPKAGM
ncbi:uncharacterized protein LOC112053487 [Bicyclus anynana]|uniref:Uncharacterized protein LOC112053487 n=1 Tax=Bicyclus anynana TaxID=110368 RepID=A0ABM3LFQ6_BICAN|nr:uncharacterized protein LOC112053487 [Bicyclus anynana]